MAKAYVLGELVVYRCPACKHQHSVPFKRWNWNGDVDKPTLHPSVRHFYTDNENKVQHTVCHYFIKEGKIEYCNDCPHSMKGQTVELPDVETQEC